MRRKRPFSFARTRQPCMTLPSSVSRPGSPAGATTPPAGTAGVAGDPLGRDAAAPATPGAGTSCPRADAPGPATEAPGTAEAMEPAPDPLGRLQAATTNNGATTTKN